MGRTQLQPLRCFSSPMSLSRVTSASLQKLSRALKVLEASETGWVCTMQSKNLSAFPPQSKKNLGNSSGSSAAQLRSS